MLSTSSLPEILMRLAFGVGSGVIRMANDDGGGNEESICHCVLRMEVVTVPVHLSGVGVSSDNKGEGRAGAILVISRRFSCTCGLLLREIDVGCLCVSLWSVFRVGEERWRSLTSVPSFSCFPCSLCSLPCLTPPLLPSLYHLPPTLHSVN
jgi:hypothetical protein